MNLFPWTTSLPESFENGIIQKVLDRRLYGVGQHFTFWRFSRKRKFFGDFDCDFRKYFTKGFFLNENEVSFEVSVLAAANNQIPEITVEKNGKLNLC